MREDDPTPYERSTANSAMERRQSPGSEDAVTVHEYHVVGWCLPDAVLARSWAPRNIQGQKRSS